MEQVLFVLFFSKLCVFFFSLSTLDVVKPNQPIRLVKIVCKGQIKFVLKVLRFCLSRP